MVGAVVFFYCASFASLVRRGAAITWWQIEMDESSLGLQQFLL